MRDSASLIMPAETESEMIWLKSPIHLFVVNKADMDN